MAEILIVDDENDIRELISDILVDEGYTTDGVANSDETYALLKQNMPYMIILDIWLKDSNHDGIDILKNIRKKYPEIPVVIISGHGNIEIAVAAIKQGAYDFIEKPFNIDQLLVVIRRAMETALLRRENLTLRGFGNRASKMIGQSNSFKVMKQQLEKVSMGNSRVFLRGGSGVGKELAARFIHTHSSRASKPFVVVNSASISADKMERLLFGYHLDDGKVEMGLFEQANGGTIFFDEISDMPLDTQSKILRVLVEQKFTRVGGNKTLNVDLRVLTSSTKNLEEAIKAGSFREELYHRINVVSITVPSLEVRRDDIPLLADYLIDRLCETQGFTRRQIHQDTYLYLQARKWPGNIRQLKNALESVLILGDETKVIMPKDFQNLDVSAAREENNLSASLLSLPLREARELFEREYMVSQINRFNGNISKTSTFIGMERSALHRKLKSLGIVTDNKQGARVAKLSATIKDP